MSKSAEYSLEAKREVLRKKVQFAKDCEYFIKRKLDPNTPEEPEREERIDPEKNGQSIDVHLFSGRFEHKFFAAMELEPKETKLEDYKTKALEYLSDSFPFCFGIFLRDEPETKNDTTFNLDLEFYAMSLGATDEQLDAINETLKSKKIKRYKEGNMSTQGVPTDQVISIDSIHGTTKPLYQADNLFDGLTNARDRNLSDYIRIVMLCGGLENSRKFFEGMQVCQDEEGNLFVKDGTHRWLVYEALRTVKELITGESVKGMDINAQVQRVKVKNPEIVFEER